MKTFFSESQRFTQWWLWLLIVIPMLAPIAPSLYNLMQPEASQVKEMSLETMAIYLGLFAVVIAMFLFMKLTTRIDDQYIAFTYRPMFVNKKIAWREVKSAEVINYGFVGGWGIRLWTKYGTVYNVRGKHGLHIKLNNGKQLLLGTQKEDELRQVLTQISASKGK